MPKVVGRGSSANDIYATLSFRISRLMIPMGQRLTEQGLSEEFGVSRTPVREALRLLEQAGYVERVSNLGYSVRAISLERADQIYTVRTALEVLSVELAAKEIHTSEFSKLKDDVETSIHHAAAGDLTDPDLLATELREGFHERLAAISRNAELVRILSDIDSQIYAFRRLDSAVPGRSHAAQLEHLEILRLMEHGDVDAAGEAMRQHIERSRTTVQSLLQAGVTTISFASDGSGAGK
jgi:DNA-binding GntR family transcriptional regulator